MMQNKVISVLVTSSYVLSCPILFLPQKEGRYGRCSCPEEVSAQAPKEGSFLSLSKFASLRHAA